MAVGSVAARVSGQALRRPRARLPRAAGAAAAAAARRGGGPLAAAVGGDAAPGPLPTNQMLVFVPPHPLIKHWLAVARAAQTPPPMFRNALSELGRLLIYEASRDFLPTVEMETETPCGPCSVELVDPSQPVAVVPILRAGLVLLEQTQTVLPAQITYHLGLVRDEETLEPSLYLNKLPESFGPDQRILVADPMLATGGSLCYALDEILSRGAVVQNIRVVCVVAAPPALTKLSEKYKGLQVFAAMIDEQLNEKGYIVPGLGDAGDRAYGTL